MTMLKDDGAIDSCLRLIEEKLNWGETATWSNYDFEKLSDLIQDKTNVLLSVTTLKRLWGRVKYASLPSTTTLNALAAFLDYADWRQFSQRDTMGRHGFKTPGINAETKAETETTSSADSVTAPTAGTTNGPTAATTTIAGPVFDRLLQGKPTRRKLSWRRQHWLLLMIVFIGLAALYSLTTDRSTDTASFRSASKRPDPSQFAFKADKIIGEGVPNSVIFSYDARAAETDSVYIVQSWDISRKTLVSRTGSRHSAIYYFPGFFQTKLIVDGEVVKSHDLQITSNGWLCLAEQDPAPFYFPKEQYMKQDRVEVDSNMLKAFNLTLYPKPPRVRFFNQGDMGDLMNNNFVFETTIKNEVDDGAAACHPVEVLIQCKNDIIIIPLAAHACVGDLNLYAAGAEANSNSADLSKFGCDLKQWTKLKVETIDSHMSFYVNGIKAYSFTFPNHPTGIVGVQYRFSGPGAVKDTRFTSKGKLYKL